MIVALLILIAAILLFGSGVVLGVLGNAVGVIVGFSAIMIAAIYLGSFLGENGFIYVVLGVPALIFLLLSVGIFFEDRARNRLLDSIKTSIEVETEDTQLLRYRSPLEEAKRNEIMDAARARRARKNKKHRT